MTRIVPFLLVVFFFSLSACSSGNRLAGTGSDMNDPVFQAAVATADSLSALAASSLSPDEIQFVQETRDRQAAAQNEKKWRPLMYVSAGLGAASIIAYLVLSFSG